MATLDDALDDDGPISSINIIPFVDIVLVLLVIFMLTSATIVRASLKVELPRAASAGSRVESTLNLVCGKDGRLTIDGQLVATTDEAGTIIGRQARANPRTQAVIAADRSVAYGRVVEVIDLVKANGISTFALDVERGPRPPAATR
jgi:biopolymer transport protein ExbD